MALTPAQQATLKAYVEADPALSQFPHTGDGAYALAEALKANASPDFVVWKTRVTRDEIMQNGFDWVQVDNLTVGKARIWEWLFANGQNSINPAKLNVRAGIDEAWRGTAAMLAVRDAVYVHCKRSANVLEKLFATGTGSNASPATMAVEGSLPYYEVQSAMGW